MMCYTILLLFFDFCNYYNICGSSRKGAVMRYNTFVNMW